MHQPRLGYMGPYKLEISKGGDFAGTAGQPELTFFQ